MGPCLPHLVLDPCHSLHHGSLVETTDHKQDPEQAHPTPVGPMCRRMIAESVLTETDLSQVHRRRDLYRQDHLLDDGVVAPMQTAGAEELDRYQVQ